MLRLNLKLENRKSRKNAADIDYIAMMCDVELESEEGEDEAQ